MFYSNRISYLKMSKEIQKQLFRRAMWALGLSLVMSKFTAALP